MFLLYYQLHVCICDQIYHISVLHLFILLQRLIIILYYIIWYNIIFTVSYNIIYVFVILSVTRMHM